MVSLENKRNYNGLGIFSAKWGRTITFCRILRIDPLYEVHFAGVYVCHYNIKCMHECLGEIVFSNVLCKLIFDVRSLRRNGKKEIFFVVKTFVIIRYITV